uniref:Uncharacterized protein n=1 Tax=Trichogramma kaykai TaxID=54128 RepID=A0ABD2WJH2_9HYME
MALSPNNNYNNNDDFMRRDSPSALAAPLGTHFDITIQPFFQYFFYLYRTCPLRKFHTARTRTTRRFAYRFTCAAAAVRGLLLKLGWHRKYAGTTAPVIIQRRYKREIRKNTTGLRRASGKRKRVVELMTRRATATDDDERNELITARCSPVARVIDRCSCI